MEKLIIALPNKGRLADDARHLLESAGLQFQTTGQRSLYASVGEGFEVIFVRPSDIPEFVADGAAHVGITGWDLVVESGRRLRSLLDLGFGYCRLVIAAPVNGPIRSIDDVQDGMRVATSFSRLTERFFAEAEKKITIVPVSGAAEITPRVGIADLVSDLSASGSTLRTNDLEEIATVIESTAHLVMADESADVPTDVMRRLDELVDALGSVLRARQSRYVMANVERSLLEKVRKVLPGLGGPTVMNILDDDTRLAVHAVVSMSDLYRVVADLRAVGATDIVVSPIERLLA